MAKKQDHKQITLADVAREANVSIKTVSRVINGEPYVGEATRQRVLEVIREYNYHPNRAARRLASKRSHVVGMLVPSIDYPIFPNIILGVEHVMHENNYEVLVYNTEVNTDASPERSRKGLELLAENQVDGVIVCTIKKVPNDELQQLLSRQQSAVLVNMVLPGSDAGVVRIDVVHGIELLIEHLLASGKKHIALLTYPFGQYSANERLRGYRQTLAKHNIDIDESLIVISEDNLQAVFETAQHLLKTRSEVDAIICFNDVMAGTVLKACFDLGIQIPHQVAVTGFDNILFADLLKCSLTTVNVPGFEMGVKAAEMLIDRLEGDSTVSEIIIRPELIIRESAP